LTACQLAEYLTSFYLRNWDRFGGDEREVLWELVRRVEQHERLISEVLPDLRNRLTRLECLVVSAQLPALAKLPPR
jgi:hypothetical protein